jgi:hypothetical protein
VIVLAVTIDDEQGDGVRFELSGIQRDGQVEFFTFTIDDTAGPRGRELGPITKQELAALGRLFSEAAAMAAGKVIKESDLNRGTKAP